MTGKVLKKHCHHNIARALLQEQTRSLVALSHTPETIWYMMCAMRAAQSRNCLGVAWAFSSHPGLHDSKRFGSFSWLGQVCGPGPEVNKVLLRGTAPKTSATPSFLLAMVTYQMLLRGRSQKGRCNIYVYILLHVRLCVSMCARIYVYVYVYIYTYIYVCVFSVCALLSVCVPEYVWVPVWCSSVCPSRLPLILRIVTPAMKDFLRSARAFST